MTNHLARIAVGLLLLLAAWRFHERGQRLYTSSFGLGPTKEEMPDGDDDFFDRPRPSKFAKTPESKSLRQLAISWECAAKVTGGCGIILVLLGALPIAMSARLHLRPEQQGQAQPAGKSAEPLDAPLLHWTGSTIPSPCAT